MRFVCLLFALIALAAAQTRDTAAEWEFLSLLNNERISRGLNRVEMASNVQKVAVDWTWKMANTNNFVHNPNFATQIWNSGGTGTVAENIGKGGDVNSVHNALMASTGHRTNMLNGAYNWVGIGVWRQGGYLWTTTNFEATGATSQPISCCGVAGQISVKYNVPAIKSALGAPTTNELFTPDRIGRFNHFQRGSIYWTPSTGAQSIQGNIKNKWASMGWETSPLGYPITDELTCPDKVGKYNHFQSGSIYWTPSTGAHEVRGQIKNYWASLGWEKGIGYPVSDEYSVSEGRRSDFQRGSLVWNKNTNTVRKL